MLFVQHVQCLLLVLGTAGATPVSCAQCVCVCVTERSLNSEMGKREIWEREKASDIDCNQQLIERNAIGTRIMPLTFGLCSVCMCIAACVG